jgi:hypothetical protein
MSSESEFYVGYLPMPGGLRRTILRVVVALATVAAGVAAILAAGQNPFPASTFEYQQYHDFRGTLLAEPYPALDIPGAGLPWLLVAPGKHGVGDLTALNGRTVQLRGERIMHGADHMIEIAPDSLRSVGPGEAPAVPTILGQVELTGEIVDSKCYFGVMNQGNGKVHRDCAARCISGGVPPVFLVRDARGRTQTLLLANWRRGLLDKVAEPATIRGRLVRAAGRLTLYAE